MSQRKRTNDDLYTELCPHCQKKYDERTSVFGFKGKKRTELLKILIVCRAVHESKPRWFCEKCDESFCAEEPSCTIPVSVVRCPKCGSITERVQT